MCGHFLNEYKFKVPSAHGPSPPPPNCITALENRFACCVVCINQIIIQNHKRDGDILELIMQHPQLINPNWECLQIVLDQWKMGETMINDNIECL